MAIVKEGFLLRMADGLYLEVVVMQRSDSRILFVYGACTPDWKAVDPLPASIVSKVLADRKTEGLELPVEVAWVQYTMEVEYRAMNLEGFLPKGVQP